jgi:hypothetical protein
MYLQVLLKVKMSKLYFKVWSKFDTTGLKVKVNEILITLICNQNWSWRSFFVSMGDPKHDTHDWQ